MEVPWAVTREKVEAALQKIIAISRPRKLILFASYVSGRTPIGLRMHGAFDNSHVRMIFYYCVKALQGYHA